MIYIYIRTSTQDQNPQNQLDDCMSINSYGEFKVIEDKQSAWKDNIERIGFNNLKRLIKTKRVSHLIVWDLDRLYRNRKRLIEFFNYCKYYQCKVHSFRQQWLEELHKAPQPFNDIMFDLMLNIMGWLAEEESGKKSERVKAAIRIKGNKTYSYKGNKWGRKQLSTFKKKKIKELRGSGLSIGDISKELNISKGVVHKYLP